MIREQFTISFQKILGPNKTVYHRAIAKDENFVDLAAHLSYSDVANTLGQIDVLIKTQGNFYEDGVWGEVMGSTLYIKGTNQTVQIGDDNLTITIVDFQQLLQEWLAFIHEQLN